MTYEQACYFFHKYGNVGRSLQELIDNIPSDAQLEIACYMAFKSYDMPNLVEAAKAAVLKEKSKRG